MRHLPRLLLAISLLCALACELPEASGTRDVDPEAITAERPAGWKSLEDPDAGSRLYYQFVDAAGRVRFVERIDDVPAQWRANVGFVKLPVPPPLSPGDAARARSQLAAAPRASSAAAADIVLYSAEWCGACRKAKRYLAKNDVPYEERDVDDPRVADELVRKTGTRSIPVLDVGGRVYSGFSPDAYDELTRGA